jgi:hypothetical protein
MDGMIKLLATLALLAATLAYADQVCTSRCYWIGSQQFCKTVCTDD